MVYNKYHFIAGNPIWCGQSNIDDALAWADSHHNRVYSRCLLGL